MKTNYSFYKNNDFILSYVIEIAYT